MDKPFTPLTMNTVNTPKTSPKTIQGVRGMSDLLPETALRWEALETLLQDWLAMYGYCPLRTPILESTALFKRGLGEVTDIVEKEMYSFTDLGGDQLSLRPEFTAGIVRATIEHHLLYQGPIRVFAIGPAFRHERPQRGRTRQFHQLDVEALGYPGPDIDAELILMLNRLWEQLPISKPRLEINTLGQLNERQAHRAALVKYFEQKRTQLDEDSLRRLENNPLRILDSKNPEMQGIINTAPRLLDYLGEKSKDHFQVLQDYLDRAGVQLTINPRLVRGLDYYNLTVFEWVTDLLGSQGTVCGGGRYDSLMECLGGKPSPAVGFAIGLERLLELIGEGADPAPIHQVCDVYIAHYGGASENISQTRSIAIYANTIAEKIRNLGLRVILHAGEGSFKPQMKQADRYGAVFTVIIGEDEFKNSKLTLKTMRSSDQSQNKQSLFSIEESLAYLASQTWNRKKWLAPPASHIPVQA